MILYITRSEGNDNIRQLVLTSMIMKFSVVRSFSETIAIFYWLASDYHER